jgi:hypothetical protein
VMHGEQKSDSSIVATKSVNKPGRPGAELMERREGTKENTGESPASRTQSRGIVIGGLDRVRQAARGNKKERFTALMHHVTQSYVAGLSLAQRSAPWSGWSVARLWGEPGSEAN